MNKKLFVGVVALGFSAIAFANGDTGYMPAPMPVASSVDTYSPGVYVGLQAGYGMSGWDTMDNLFGVSGVNTSDEDGFAGRVYIGYDFHKNFAVEAGYTQFFNNPKINFNNGTNNTTLWDGNNTYAIDLVGKIKASVIDNFGLYAKAGVDYLHGELSPTASLKAAHPGSHHFSDPYPNAPQLGDGVFNVVYGVGAYYDITPNFSVDLSWTRYNGDPNLDSTDYMPYADLYAIGVAYKFNLS